MSGIYHHFCNCKFFFLFFFYFLFTGLIQVPKTPCSWPILDTKIPRFWGQKFGVVPQISIYSSLLPFSNYVALFHSPHVTPCWPAGLTQEVPDDSIFPQLPYFDIFLDPQFPDGPVRRPPGRSPRCLPLALQVIMHTCARMHAWPPMHACIHVYPGIHMKTCTIEHCSITQLHLCNSPSQP